MDQSHYVPPHAIDATSSRLLERLGQKDPEAWRQLVRLYGPVVRFWIRKAGLNKADLADVFQETFLAVSRNVGNFQRQSGDAKFRAWLKTVTTSKINDHFRRQGKQPLAFGGSTAMQRMEEVQGDTPSDSLADQQGLEESAEAFLAQRTLQMVKNEFRPQTWQAFLRTAVDGRTSQEVAAELGISPLAVRKAKSRILARLRQVMGEPMPPPSANEANKDTENT